MTHRGLVVVVFPNLCGIEFIFFFCFWGGGAFQRCRSLQGSRFPHLTSERNGVSCIGMLFRACWDNALLLFLPFVGTR